MKTLSELKSALGLTKAPASWEGYLATLTDATCPWLSDEFFVTFQKENPIFPQTLPHLLAAAKQVREDEDLSLYTRLLSMSIADKDTVQRDIGELSLPEAPEGRPAVGYELAAMLANLPYIPPVMDRLRKRGLPEEVVLKTYSIYERRMLGDVAGRVVLTLPALSWVQLFLLEILIYVNRLEFHMTNDIYGGAFGIYRSRIGDYRFLAERGRYGADGRTKGKDEPRSDDEINATFRETEDAYIANGMTVMGTVLPEKVTLKKGEWTRVAGPESPVITVHIPEGPGLTEDAVRASFIEAKAIFARCFPEFKTEFFHCHSWLMDTQLSEFLSPTSNMMRFQEYFLHGTTNTFDNCVFEYLYGGASHDDLAALPENTGLQRRVKAHLLAGGHIYEQNGIVPFEFVP